MPARGEDDLEPDHPHICTLFDVGREVDIDYLVMELVEGDTVARRRTTPLVPELGLEPARSRESGR